jgi:hypothetical protein
VETNLKTTGESDILSGVAAGGNDLVHCNVDALNSAALESVGVAARVTERHDADSAQDNDNVPGNSGCHDMRRGAVQDACFNWKGSSCESYGLCRKSPSVYKCRNSLTADSMVFGVNEAQDMRTGAVQDAILNWKGSSCKSYGLRRESASVSKCQNSLTGEDAALDVNDASFCASVRFDVDKKRQKCEGGSSVCLGDTK